MKLRITLILLALFAIFMTAGCSDDKPTNSNNNPGDTTSTTTTVWNADGYWESLINATGSDQFIYYSFGRKDTITLTDPQAQSDTSWDIAFKRSTIILNGGVSGSGSVDGVDLAEIGHADSTNFAGLANISSIGNPTWVDDSYELIIDDWYSYNPNTHSLAATGYVYIMMDAVGEYVKFKILNLLDPGMPPDMGTITIEYIHSGTSPTFSGTPDTLTFPAHEGPVYIDFSAHAVTNPVDPLNSENWDILFDNYEIHQNATIFGSGDAAAYAVWQDQTDPTDFNETETAPTVPQAYFPDELGSVMTNWYNYNGDTHTLTSKLHVYVIRDGADYYKLQIVTYYRDIGGSPVSAWYTYKWLALE